MEEEKCWRTEVWKEEGGRGERSEAVLTDRLQGGILIELFARWLLIIRVGDLAQAGVGMRMAHLLQQRGGGHCVVHLGSVCKQRQWEMVTDRAGPFTHPHHHHIPGDQTSHPWGWDRNNVRGCADTGNNPLHTYYRRTAEDGWVKGKGYA